MALGLFGAVLAFGGLARESAGWVVQSLCIFSGVSCIFAAVLIEFIKDFSAGRDGLRFTAREVGRQLESEVTLRYLELPSGRLPPALESKVQNAPSSRSSGFEQDYGISGLVEGIVADELIPRLLRQTESDLLSDCIFHLFMHDEDRRRLLPVFEPGHESEGWKIGHGAIGMAYARRDYVLLRGAAICSDECGLTEAQKHRFRHLKVVAAMPVVTPSGHVVAVLSAASLNNESKLAVGEGYTEHWRLALSISRVLVDILKWYPE